MPSIKHLYLVAYNLIAAISWALLLSRVLALTLGPNSSYEKTYAVTGNLARNIQTAAMLEIVHSAAG